MAARATPLLPLLLLVLATATSFSPASAHSNKKNKTPPTYDCGLKTTPDEWSLQCSEDGACSVTLPAGSFPLGASRVTCVLTFDEAATEPPLGVLSSYELMLAAESTPIAPVAAVCDDNPVSNECGELAATQLRTKTVKLTSSARKNGLTIAFAPNVYVPPNVDADNPAQGFVSCAALRSASKHGKKNAAQCSEELGPAVLQSEVACLPGDATVRRVVVGGQDKFETVRLDELRLGDEVECVAPVGEGSTSSDPSTWTDASLDWKPTTCRVYYYLDATAKESRFVTLHYSLSDGTPATFRATREHLAFIAAASVPANTPTPTPPRASAKRMDAVVIGDLITVRSASDASFYTAPVAAITFESGDGAYAPLLTKAGLLVADNAVVFPHAHVLSNVPVHPMTHLGEYYRHCRIWTEFEDIVTSGCEGDACPCLDARRADGFCAKVGLKLRDLPEGVSTFTGRSLQVLRRAAAEGRTEVGYETVLRAAPLIRAYLYATTKLPLLRTLFKPTDGPAGDVTHRVADFVMRVPASASAKVAAT
jgi:hypothetical protein